MLRHSGPIRSSIAPDTSRENKGPRGATSGKPISASRSAVEAHAHETAAEKHDVPAVLVDEHFQVVRLYGDTAPFLRFKSGEPTLNLLSLLAPRLGAPLESAAQEALALSLAKLYQSTGRPIQAHSVFALEGFSPTST
jgi:hypothetical protein